MILQFHNSEISRRVMIMRTSEIVSAPAPTPY